jgi:hypothetical protein
MRRWHVACTTPSRLWGSRTLARADHEFDQAPESGPDVWSRDWNGAPARLWVSTKSRRSTCARLRLGERSSLRTVARLSPNSRASRGIRGTLLHGELVEDYGYGGSYPAFIRHLRRLRSSVVKYPEIRLRDRPRKARPGRLGAPAPAPIRARPLLRLYGHGHCARIQQGGSRPLRHRPGAGDRLREAGLLPRRPSQKC